MGINKPVMAVMAILVTVLIVSTVAVPMIEDSQKDSEISRNNSYAKYSLTDYNEDFTLKIENKTGSTPVITFNGDNIKFEEYGMFLFSEEIYLSITSGSTIWVNNAKSLSMSKNLDCTLEITKIKDSISYSYSVPEKTETGSIKLTKPLFTYDVNGDYLVSSGTIKINEYSEFYVFSMGGSWGTSYMSGPITLKSLPGTIGGWTPVSGSAPTPADPVELKINKVEKSGYFDMSNVMAGEIKCTVLAPIEYTELVPKDSTIISMLQIIPILLLLVPVFVAVAAIRGRTD